ncbi:Ni-sirohydrochlorin a,c-diamide reductive cyclase catalytic subunit [Methanoplanus sp. FWC-SCC4]|uniref:Ni-sirohydrochlorin a,c-diamide reductive cyclase catalytic subunit n=1 Tax=Methanochimaera problematica TaxID=2609417 RepID=A0AA97I4G0_9EURY|nr:Ni-sirohydrochlorin a,c-diamide reductive cyclase catalytic subunit [Methanoplanus sp. FWC-SCC4]WOF16306.1 Ni-sirohydrochlorin a,c-diamide reductive cyclase catalytic subunit [Methanoplanus sp. FWC-SCC4]
MEYIQPRPSSIVAGLYTVRDLGVDLAILHGPSGCSFKHARLLEEDGLRVLTTSLGDNEFIFGGQDVLERVLRYAEKEFSPKRIAVVGTCVSMIIGEDMEAAIEDSGISTPAIAVEIHAGFRENIDGVIAALEPAARAGWIDEDELERQKKLLAAANLVERQRGAAYKPYVQPSRGDLKHLFAKRLLELANSGKKGIAIMNAKKETAYMFADALIALREVCPECDIRYVANLEDRGLPKVRKDAENIREGLLESGVEVEYAGSLDEYGANGERLGEIIKATKPDFALISGVPHAIPPEYLEGIEVFSITNGPRQVEPLKEFGHDHVVVEVDLHPKTLGVKEIVRSESGDVMRSMK